jgi:hypothetical protein
VVHLPEEREGEKDKDKDKEKDRGLHARRRCKSRAIPEFVRYSSEFTE